MRPLVALAAVAALAALGACLAAEPARAELCETRGRRCSTPPPRPGRAKAATEAAIAAAALPGAGKQIVVPVVFHVVYDVHMNEPEGIEPDDLAHAPPLVLVQRQMRELKRAFRGTGISFVEAGVEERSFDPWRTESAPGGPPQDDELAAMVSDAVARRQLALHVFLLRFVDNTAASPDRKMLFDHYRQTDGILMNWEYLPYDAALAPVHDPEIPRLHAEGDMLVHLVGHWFGLVHTFEGWPVAGQPAACRPKCGQITDFVLDTPVHRLPEIELDRCYAMDSCPSLPGIDPVHNYMNLVPDFCASELTPGQIERIEHLVRFYRPYLIVPAPAGPR